MARFYTVSQTARILGFSTNSIYKFLDQKRLKSTRGNSKQGRFRIPHSAIEEFLGTTLSETAVAQALAKPKLKTPPLKTFTPSAPPSPARPTSYPPVIPRHLTRSSPSAPHRSPFIQESGPAAAESREAAALPHRAPLGLTFTRFLILAALIVTILEVVTSPTVTVTGQLFRLIILSIAILLAYQTGGAKEDPRS